MRWKSYAVSGSGLLILGWALSGLLAAPGVVQHKAEKSNMELVGYSDLQARSAYQPVIQKQGDRWIAYVGHHGGVQPNQLTGKDELNGTSDVALSKLPYEKLCPGSAALAELQEEYR